MSGRVEVGIGLVNSGWMLSVMVRVGVRIEKHCHLLVPEISLISSEHQAELSLSY